ncbi:MAG: GNAT family N-acetyltransferase [Flavobacteriaceae bacterium]
MEFSISTDKKRLDLDKIYTFISRETYWGHGRSEKEFQTTVDNSFCFGMYDGQGEQIGFARVVTDYVVFAYLMDVVIFKPYQGQGFGKALMKAIMEHEALEKIKTFALKTKDAKSLYTKFGFKSLCKSEMWMTKDTFEYQ